MIIMASPKILQEMFNTFIVRNGLPLELSGTPAFLTADEQNVDSIWSVSFKPLVEAPLAVYKVVLQRACSKEENIVYKKVYSVSVSIDSNTWNDRIQLQCVLPGIEPPVSSNQIIQKQQVDLSQWSGIFQEGLSNLEVHSKAVTTKTSAATSFNIISSPTEHGTPIPITGSDAPGVPLDLLSGMVYAQKNPTIYAHEPQIVYRGTISSKAARGDVLLDLDLGKLINQNMVSATKDCSTFKGSIIGTVEMLANPVVAGAIMVGYVPPGTTNITEEVMMGTECGVVSATDSQFFSFVLKPYIKSTGSPQGRYGWLNFDTTTGEYTLPKTTKDAYPHLVIIARNAFVAFNTATEAVVNVTVMSSFGPDFFAFSEGPEITGLKLTDSAWVAPKSDVFGASRSVLTSYGLEPNAVIAIDGRATPKERIVYPSVILHFASCDTINEGATIKNVGMWTYGANTVVGSPGVRSYGTCFLEITTREDTGSETSLTMQLHLGTTTDPYNSFGEPHTQYMQAERYYGDFKARAVGVVEVYLTATDIVPSLKSYEFDVELDSTRKATVTRHVGNLSSDGTINNYYMVFDNYESELKVLDIPLPGLKSMKYVVKSYSVNVTFDFSSTSLIRGITNQDITILPGNSCDVCVIEPKDGVLPNIPQTGILTDSYNTGPSLLDCPSLYHYLYPAFNENLVRFDLVELVTNTVMATMVYHPKIKTVFTTHRTAGSNDSQCYMVSRYSAGQMALSNVQLLVDNGNYPSTQDVVGFVTRLLGDSTALVRGIESMNVHGNAEAVLGASTAVNALQPLVNYYQNKANQDWYWKQKQAEYEQEQALLTAKNKNALDIANVQAQNQLDLQRAKLDSQYGLAPSNGVSTSVNSSSTVPYVYHSTLGSNVPSNPSDSDENDISRRAISMRDGKINISEGNRVQPGPSTTSSVSTSDENTGGKVIYPTSTNPDLTTMIQQTANKVKGGNVDANGDLVPSGNLASLLKEDEYRMPNLDAQDLIDAKADPAQNLAFQSDYSYYNSPDTSTDGLGVTPQGPQYQVEDPQENPPPVPKTWMEKWNLSKHAKSSGLHSAVQKLQPK